MTVVTESDYVITCLR